MASIKELKILGMRVDRTSYKEASSKVISWTKSSHGHYVFAANVHMVMESYDENEFKQIVNKADLVTPDGVPLVWMLRMMGAKHQERVYGPDLMLEICNQAGKHNIPIGLYGGRANHLNDLVSNLTNKFPKLRIDYKFSPPFEKVSQKDDDKIIENILNSKVKILFIGLGCPKQELWVIKHIDRLPIVFVAVGAAFDFHSGRIPNAPNILKRLGLEWLYRLVHEPKRLGWRYLKNNPRFIFLAFIQIVKVNLFRTPQK